MTQQRKAVLITRKTRLEELVAQYNTESQAAFVIESRGLDFYEYQEEHRSYQTAIARVENQLRTQLRVQCLEREFLSNYIFADDDVIVVVGQDGLVANTLKYLNGQPVIAINPDSKKYDGILLPFTVKDTELIAKDVLKQQFRCKTITMAKAILADGQELVAVNDLFIGPRYQISARYEIEYKGKTEIQSSSGAIISTGLGSTGWLTSIMKGAEQIAGLKLNKQAGFAWDANELLFAIREPFPSHTTGIELTYGEISETNTLKISSLMANHGVIFSDGMVDDFIDFNSGAIVSIGLATRVGSLVV